MDNFINKLFDLLSFSNLFNMNKTENLIKNNNFCLECNKPKFKKCRICNKSKGLMVECYDENCDFILHVECARRVNCELGFPLKNLSKEMIHTVYCENHSLSPGERKRINLKKIQKKEILQVETKIKAKWLSLIHI